jgi:tellurite methyltransferase
MIDLARELGNIDIYLLDQILRGRIPKGARVLDAGCGQGRNLVYLLRAGYTVFGVDGSSEAIASARRLASEIASDASPSSFRVESVESMSFADASADVVLSSAVLHFARDHAHFDAMIFEMWRVLASGGLFFARLASSIGMEDRMRPLGKGRFALPDGSERYLVDEARLMDRTAALGGVLLDPLKTTVVQSQRCMTTWVLRKPE